MLQYYEHSELEDGSLGVSILRALWAWRRFSGCFYTTSPLSLKMGLWVFLYYKHFELEDGSVGVSILRALWAWRRVSSSWCCYTVSAHGWHCTVCQITRPSYFYTYNLTFRSVRSTSAKFLEVLFSLLWLFVINTFIRTVINNNEHSFNLLLV